MNGYGEDFVHANNKITINITIMLEIVRNFVIDGCQQGDDKGSRGRA